MKIASCSLLINKNGQILAVSRKDNHSIFGLPGGKMDDIDSGDPEKTAIRETKEEIGLDISNLRLVLAIHMDGFMTYTYLADWEGDIKTDEPHVIKWTNFDTIVEGTFGEYNKLVKKSIENMGIKVQ